MIMQKPSEFDRAFATSRSVAAVLGASLLVYLLLEEIIRGRYRPFFGFAKVKDLAGMRYSGFAAAVVVVIGLRFLHARLTAAAMRAGDGPAAVRLLFRASVLGLTLAEVPSIIGLALFLLGGLNKDFYLLLFVSSALVFMYFPRAAAWTAVLEKRRPGCPM
jgi:hypothetical protein